MLRAPAKRLIRKAVPGHRARVAGIDLGSHAAKVVLATEADGRQAIVAAGRIVDGAEQEYDPAQLAAAVGRWLRNWGAFTVESAICSLPSMYTDYECTAASTGGAAMDHVASSALQELLGPAAAESTCAYWQSRHEAVDDAVGSLHLVWAADEVAGEVARVLGRRGLACRIVESTPSTLARVASQIDDATQLVVDLGRDTATCTLVEAGETTYVRHRVALATAAAVERTADSMGLSRVAAETLLELEGCDAAAGPIARRIAVSLESWLRTLHFELQRTLAYVNSREQSRPIDQIVLCGGGSMVRGVAPWLQSRLDTTVTTAPAPSGCVWAAAEPYNPIYAEAAALALMEDGQ